MQTNKTALVPVDYADLPAAVKAKIEHTRELISVAVVNEREYALTLNSLVSDMETCGFKSIRQLAEYYHIGGSNAEHFVKVAKRFLTADAVEDMRKVDAELPDRLKDMSVSMLYELSALTYEQIATMGNDALTGTQKQLRLAAKEVKNTGKTTVVDGVALVDVCAPVNIPSRFSYSDINALAMGDLEIITRCILADIGGLSIDDDSNIRYSATLIKRKRTHERDTSPVTYKDARTYVYVGLNGTCLSFSTMPYAVYKAQGNNKSAPDGRLAQYKITADAMRSSGITDTVITQTLSAMGATADEISQIID